MVNCGENFKEDCGMEMNMEKGRVMRISRQRSPVHFMIDKKQMKICGILKLFGYRDKLRKMYMLNYNRSCHGKRRVQEEVSTPANLTYTSEESSEMLHLEYSCYGAER